MLGAAAPGQTGPLPGFLTTAVPDPERVYDLLCVDFDVPRVAEALQAAGGGGGGAWEAEVFRGGEIDTTSIWESWIAAEWAGNCGRDQRPAGK